MEELKMIKIKKVIDIHTHPRTPATLPYWNLHTQSTKNHNVKTQEESEVLDIYMHMFRSRNFVENPYTVEEVLKLMDEAHLEKIVVIALNYETNEKYGGFRIPNELVADMVKAHPDRFYGVAAVDPHKGMIAVKELEFALKELGLKGMKVLPNRHEMYPNDKKYYPLYEKCLEYDVPIWIHIGYSPQARMHSKWSDPMTIDDIAIDFPDLRIIGNHIGFPYSDVMISNCMKHPNVYVDTAAWPPSGLPDTFIKFMNGPLRYKVLYGTDWCLMSWEKTIAQMEKVCKDEKVAQLVLHDNAVRVLKLNK